MPTFDTPEPISVTLDLGIGAARVVASDRTDTVVDVQPSVPSREPDVRAARQTRVDHANGTLIVKAPKQRHLLGKGGSIDVSIHLPAGSHLSGDAAWGDLRGEGRLGECRLRSAYGDIHLDQAGTLDLKTASGDITVDRAGGDAEVTTGSGTVRIHEIDGAVVVKNSNGDTRIGKVAGDARLRAANGDILVDRADASVVAKTACGSVRVGDVGRGSVVVETAYGELEVGIRPGSAALLDVRSMYGNVQSSLDPSDGPGQSESTVEVRARTAYGDVVIRRSRLIDREA